MRGLHNKQQYNRYGWVDVGISANYNGGAFGGKYLGRPGTASTFEALLLCPTWSTHLF
jgi:hypothetical protein